MLITAGTLILLFVVYQLWGTGIQTAKAQHQLRSEFNQIIASDASHPTTTTTTTEPKVSPGGGLIVTPTKVLASDIPLPAYGDPIAEISIPKIGITRTVVEGVGLDQLKRGPGHYPETPLPGQAGNAAIAGHRTTYGEPFHNVDKLAVGDQILITTRQRPKSPFVYRIDRITIVRPDQSEVLLPTFDANHHLENRITLTACNPKYSASQRIIISGLLIGQPVAALSGEEQAREKALAEENKHHVANSATIGGADVVAKAPLSPVIEWGLLCLAIWLGSWIAQTLLRRRMRRRASDEAVMGDGSGNPSLAERLFTWTPYVVGLPMFVFTLYFFFENFVRLRDWSAWKPPGF